MRILLFFATPWFRHTIPSTLYEVFVIPITMGIVFALCHAEVLLFQSIGIVSFRLITYEPSIRVRALMFHKEFSFCLWSIHSKFSFLCCLAFFTLLIILRRICGEWKDRRNIPLSSIIHVICSWENSLCLCSIVNSPSFSSLFALHLPRAFVYKYRASAVNFLLTLNTSQHFNNQKKTTAYTNNLVTSQSLKVSAQRQDAF